jgi:hydroxyacylglutathione hydrolase
VFTVEAVPAQELGNASFLVADRERGVALVIDPFRDVGPYLRIADRLGVKVTNALDTHLHNDFVSGRRTT